MSVPIISAAHCFMAWVNIAYVCWYDANMTAEKKKKPQLAENLQNPVMAALCGEHAETHFLETTY